MYQEQLERIASSKMALIMMLLGFSFLSAPNPNAFRILAENGLRLFPSVLGMMCILGMIGYVLLPHPSLMRLEVRFRRTLFLIFSFPIAAYMTTLGYINLQAGMGFTTLVYLAIYGLIFLTAFAVYNGYNRVIEVIVIIILAAFFAFSAFVFMTRPISFLYNFNLSPFGFTILCVLGSIGYSLMLFPRVRALPSVWKRLWFILSEIAVPVYALFVLVNALSNATSWIGGIALMGFYSIIALLGQALYRPETAGND